MTHPHLNRASPWVIDTRAAGVSHHDGPGLAHRLDVAAPPPEQTVAGVLEVRPTSTVTVHGRLESVAEGVLVTATAAAEAHGTCSRCLIDIVVPLQASVQELFAYPDSLTAQTTDPDEIPRVDDDAIDIAPLIHDELVLAMPTIPLCRPDCPGLCPQCGQRLDSVGPDHRHEILDPRWAALAGLLGPSDSNPEPISTQSEEK